MFQTIPYPLKTNWWDTLHGMFLKWRNTTKSISNIWHFSTWWRNCQNMQEIKITWWQDSRANLAHLAAMFCPFLVGPQKAIMRIEFLPYFCNSLTKSILKNVAKCWKDFLLYIVHYTRNIPWCVLIFCVVAKQSKSSWYSSGTQEDICRGFAIMCIYSTNRGRINSKANCKMDLLCRPWNYNLEKLEVFCNLKLWMQLHAK